MKKENELFDIKITKDGPCCILIYEGGDSYEILRGLWFVNTDDILKNAFYCDVTESYLVRDNSISACRSVYASFVKELEGIVFELIKK